MGAVKAARGTLWESKWALTILVWSVFMPHMANQAGWFTAEIGRQPWIVYGLLRTSAGLSKVVTANQVLASLIMFFLLYALLAVLFFYLLNRRIQEGPEEPTWPENLAPEAK